jgi:copper oxidase (laccase) domain-containing protein
MVLRIFTSNISNGSMKSVHDGNLVKSNQSRTDFLLQNNIQPEATTLVRLEYEGDDYCRYATIDDKYKGDGIVRASTIVNDGLVVSKPNHALFLPLADCIGAVLHDPVKNILMVSHLGRHNLEQFGGSRSVEFLQKYHDVNPQDVAVWLSPAAGKTNYPLFAFGGRSLHDVATEQLINAGILRENIDISAIDTSLDDNYHSHSQFLKGKRNNDGRFAIVAFMSD